MTILALTATQDHATGHYRVSAYYREQFYWLEAKTRLAVPQVAQKIAEQLGLPEDTELNITYRLGRQRSVKRMRET